MAKKTYRTYHLKGLQLLLCDDCGRPMEITFRSGCQIDSTAKFTTSDEKLQSVLESCNGFNRDFYLESTREVTSKAEEPAAPVVEDAEKENNTQNVEVADKGEAIEWLKEHNPEAGYTAAKLRSKEAFNAACAENNVEFKFV